MRYPQKTYDAMLDTVIERSPNNMVSWFLMASWLYYVANESLLTDERYDQLAKDINSKWGELKHRHKPIIDRESLSAGTAYTIRDEDYPALVVYSACSLAGIAAPAYSKRAQYESP